MSKAKPRYFSEGKLRTTHTFKGVEYTFSYPVLREWARQYLREREGVKGI